MNILKITEINNLLFFKLFYIYDFNKYSYIDILIYNIDTLITTNNYI